MQSDISYQFSGPNISKSASNYVYMTPKSVSYNNMSIPIAETRLSPCTKKEQA